MRLRPTALMLGLVLAAAACGGGPSLTEYAEELEVLVGTMNSRMDENDLRLDSGAQTVEIIQAYAVDRIEIRTTFLAEFEELGEPPDDAADLHAAALEAVRNLVAAEQELFEVASRTNDLSVLTRLWDTPAGEAARAADQQAIAICQAAEASLNSTQERQAFIGVPWVPRELQEIVNVAFGCTAEDRAGGG